MQITQFVLQMKPEKREIGKEQRQQTCLWRCFQANNFSAGFWNWNSGFLQSIDYDCRVSLDTRKDNFPSGYIHMALSTKCYLSKVQSDEVLSQNMFP